MLHAREDYNVIQDTTAARKLADLVLSMELVTDAALEPRRLFAFRLLLGVVGAPAIVARLEIWNVTPAADQHGRAERRPHGIPIPCPARPVTCPMVDHVRIAAAWAHENQTATLDITQDLR